VLYACKNGHTLFNSQRETEIEREKEGEREKKEKCRICPELLFLFLKGMAGALTPFNYLVYYNGFYFINLLSKNSIFCNRYRLEPSCTITLLYLKALQAEGLLGMRP
jgi:hypothetical protein